MTTLDFANPIYSDEEAARKHLEGIRWPNGVVCPLCGSVEGIRPVAGESMGPGWYYCGACTGKFTVRVGSIYERSHIPLHKWLLAFRLMASSKKGISAHQLHRTLGITYKSAWFMAHRIREAMREDGDLPQMGGSGKTVEADETYIGGKRHGKNAAGLQYSQMDKMKVVALVERGGKSRAFHVDEVTQYTVGAIVQKHVSPASTLHTDEARYYPAIGKAFASHGTVNHKAKEYARGDVTTNSVEGYFSVFKRGMKGVYQHCGEQHLQRYLNEFDFRYSNRAALGVDDAERTIRALKGAPGKRLTYRRPKGKAA